MDLSFWGAFFFFTKSPKKLNFFWALICLGQNPPSPIGGGNLAFFSFANGNVFKNHCVGKIFVVLGKKKKNWGVGPPGGPWAQILGGIKNSGIAFFCLGPNYFPCKKKNCLHWGGTLVSFIWGGPKSSFYYGGGNLFFLLFLICFRGGFFFFLP